MIVLDGGASGLQDSSNWWGYMEDEGANPTARYESDPSGEFEQQGSYQGFLNGLGEISVEFGGPLDVSSGGVGEYELEGFGGIFDKFKKAAKMGARFGAKVGDKGLPIVKQFGPWGKAIAGAHQAIAKPMTKKFAGKGGGGGGGVPQDYATSSGALTSEDPSAGPVGSGPGVGPGFFTTRNKALMGVGLVLVAGLAYSVSRRKKVASRVRRYWRRR